VIARALDPATQGDGLINVFGPKLATCMRAEQGIVLRERLANDEREYVIVRPDALGQILVGGDGPDSPPGRANRRLRLFTAIVR
jgi:hypothetical protein